MYELDREIALNVITLDDNATRATIVEKTQKTDHVISLLDNVEMQDLLQQVARQVDMGTVQLQLSSWDGLHLESMENQTASINYVRIVPAVTVFDNILPELFAKLNISEPITILIDDFYDPRNNQWEQVFTQLPLQVNFLTMANASQPSAVQQQLQSLNTRIVVLVAKTTNIEKYILNSQQFIESRRFLWLSYSKDTLPFKCDQCVSTDMFWIRTLPGTVTDLRLLAEFVASQELDVDMNYKIHSYEELWVSPCIDAMKMSFLYIVANNNTLFEIIPKDMKTVVTSLPSDRSLLDVINSPHLYYEYGSYVPYYQSYYYQAMALPDANINKYIGNWTFMDGVIPFYGSLGVNVRSISHYRIVTIIQEPFIQYSSNSNMNGSFEGYCIDLINLIQDQIRFTYEIYIVADGRFGSVDDNGNWNGMIGDLVIGTADIALAPLSVMAERENDVDFTVPYYDLVGTTIMMKKSDVEYSLFKFMQVLEWPVWLCIVGAYLFTSFLLWIFDRFSPYSYSNNKEKFKDDPDKREFTLKECLWFCMTSLTPQGGGEAPKNISGRLVAATWWLFGFIIIASYTANLAAFLTVSRLEQSITSLDDLAKQYKVEYAPIKGGATETYFKRMAQIEELLYNTWKAMSLNESMSPLDRAKLAVWDYPVSDKYTNMWRYMQESKLPNSISEAVNRVLNSETGFAFIGDAMEIQYAILTNCKLQQIGTEFSRKPYAIAVQSGSALKDEFSAAILKLLNERQLESLKDKWWNENPHAVKCPDASDQSNGISIQNIGGVFIIILAGIVLSFITLIFEYLYYKRKRNNHVEQKPVTDTVTLDTNPPSNHVALHNGSAVHYNNFAFQF